MKVESRGAIDRTDSVVLPMRGQVFRRSPRPRTSLRLPRGLPICTQVQAGSVFLKNETGDPSHVRISAAVGLVTPTHLEGVTIGVGGKVRPCVPLVDQFWIR